MHADKHVSFCLEQDSTNEIQYFKKLKMNNNPLHSRGEKNIYFLKINVIMVNLHTQVHVWS